MYIIMYVQYLQACNMDYEIYCKIHAEAHCTCVHMQAYANVHVHVHVGTCTTSYDLQSPTYM